MILLLGLINFLNLRLDSILTWIVQQLQLQRHTPGANPATIQAFVTKPLEATVGSSKDIDYMTSKSALGKTSMVTIYIKLEYNTNNVFSEVVKMLTLYSISYLKMHTPLLLNLILQVTFLF